MAGRHITGTETRGTITKNNELGSIIKDDKQQFTCADRAIKKAGSVNHPNILNTNFSALASQSLWKQCGHLLTVYSEGKFSNYESIQISINFQLLKSAKSKILLSTLITD